MAEKLIAYKDKDLEGDTWAERCFVFQTKEDVVNFFKEDNPVLIDIYTDEDSPVLKKFEVTNDNPALLITCVAFETEYAGKVLIQQMLSGYIIN